MLMEKTITLVLTASRFAAKPVIVKVGQPATVFHVNEERIAESSEFFKAALKKEWPSGRNRTAELPDEDPKIFNVYLNWIYARVLCLDITTEEERVDSAVTLRKVAAHALGDMLMDSDFKDAVTDAFLVYTLTLDKDNNTCYLPHVNVRNKLYSNTTPGSKLRQSLVHRMMRSNSASLVEEKDCTAFLVDVTKKMLEKDTESALAAAAKCKYHEHAEGDEHCYRTKYAKATSMNMSRW